MTRPPATTPPSVPATTAPRGTSSGRAADLSRMAVTEARKPVVKAATECPLDVMSVATAHSIVTAAAGNATKAKGSKGKKAVDTKPKGGATAQKYALELWDDSDAGRLAFWQALCIEFGLVAHREATPASTKTRGASVCDRPQLVPMPGTLTQAGNLLDARAHVNLVDWLNARARARAAKGRNKPAVWGAHASLVFPSAEALASYTREANKKRHAARKQAKRDGTVFEDDAKIFDKSMAKAAGLAPLMRFIFTPPARKGKKGAAA